MDRDKIFNRAALIGASGFVFPGVGAIIAASGIAIWDGVPLLCRGLMATGKGAAKLTSRLAKDAGDRRVRRRIADLPPPPPEPTREQEVEELRARYEADCERVGRSNVPESQKEYELAYLLAKFIDARESVR